MIFCILGYTFRISLTYFWSDTMEDGKRKEFIKNTFNTVAMGYDNPALRFFKKSAALIPQYFNFIGNEHVLDVATGTGNAAINLAKALTTGNVVGVDMSEGMLAEAKDKAELNKLNNIEFIAMDMTNLTFPGDQFDGINCSYGLFFLEDMHSLLDHLVQKLKPGGKFVSCCFTENSFQPQTDLFFERIQQYGVEIPESVGFKRLASSEKSTALYQSAHLKNIKTFQHDVGCIQKDAKEWWDVVWYAGFRGFVNQLSENDLEKFKQEHLAEISALSTDEGIPFEVGVIFTVGEK